MDASTTALTPETDAFTRFAVSLSGDHSYIHQGKSFSAMGSTSLAANANYGVTILTPAATVGFVHYRPALISSSASYIGVTLLEAPTVSGGTPGTIINRERNNTAASGCTYKYGVTYTSGGTTLDMTSAGSGWTPPARAGGAMGSDVELVLKPETTYILLINNPTGGATTTVIWNLFWYEETMG